MTAHVRVWTERVCASKLEVGDQIVIPNGSSFPVLAIEQDAEEVRIRTGGMTGRQGSDCGSGFIYCPLKTKFKVRRNTPEATS